MMIPDLTADSQNWTNHYVIRAYQRSRSTHVQVGTRPSSDPMASTF